MGSECTECRFWDFAATKPTSKNKDPDYTVVLQPTAPLRDANDIDNAIALLKEKKADAIISVCKTSHSPLWCNRLPDDLSFDKFIDPKIVHTRSQDLPIFYLHKTAS